jgi:hypothetical protein
MMRQDQVGQMNLKTGINGSQLHAGTELAAAGQRAAKEAVDAP